MIRLLLLALLFLNLQAKDHAPTIVVQIDDPQEAQNTPFFKAAQHLYDSLVDSHNSALQVALKAKCDPSKMDRSFMTPQVVTRHYKTWISLAIQMIDHVPFMQRLKSLPLYPQIRGFEALHAFAMVRAKISGEVNCEDALENGAPPPKPLEAQKLLETLQYNLKFFYSLLINISKQGLPLESFLNHLTWVGFFDYQSTLIDNLNFASKDYDTNFKAVENMVAKGSSPTILHLKTLRAGLDNFLFNNGDYDIAYEEKRAYYKQLQTTLGVSLYDMQLLKNYYAYRFDIWLKGVRTLSPSQPPAPLDRVGFYACLKDSTTDTLACQALLKNPDMDFYNYFRRVRLITFGDEPCLYLTPQNTLQNFPSKDPLCQTLQANPPQMGVVVPSNVAKAFQEAQDSLIYMINKTPHDLKPFKERLQAILQATPLAALQGPKWHHVLDYKRLHLLALLSGSLNFTDFDTDTYYSGSASAPMLAYNYLHLLDFFYTPLIKAVKLGLDPSAYLHNLKQSAPHSNYPCKKDDSCTRPKNTPKSPWLEDFRSAKSGTFLVNRYKFNFSFEDLIYVKWSAPAWDEKLGYLFYGDLAKWWTPKQAPLWDLHYKKRIEAFFTNQDIYTDTLLHPEKVSKDRLSANPTACLQPQYLNKEAKATCLQIFQQHTYDPKPLQEYLKSLRLLSINNAPCVYLNSKDKLQAFKSDNTICLALQKMEF
ncbi:glycoside hydrolase [Helicobacter bizzozeronii]|uniref:glycoside hydrolase n=1 Tax=Helicobacter bizzozeronii TaxID=56877 RepID=UPI000CF0EA83|nr:glycoside hydrolase [Helicobacter bizzozeronii]